uniref:NAD-dependent epimerase/dehydratase domain-containing protein n=1 Tax=Nothoprocta perdicaria TaxID=30464 RepID=A0A8C7EEP9_NOTPE
MRVLVGGGTGFVGRALTQLLRLRGHEVTHVSRQGGKDRISWVCDESDHRRSNMPGLRNKLAYPVLLLIQGACVWESVFPECNIGLLSAPCVKAMGMGNAADPKNKIFSIHAYATGYVPQVHKGYGWTFV